MTADQALVPGGQPALVFPAQTRETARILAFHGGGGVGGAPDMLVPFCTVLRDRIPGLAIIAAGYRTLDRNKAGLTDMLDDAARALTWCQSDQPEGSDLFVFGASFGGLLALDAVYKSADGVEGLILMNPVTDIAAGGFANRVIAPAGRPEHSPMQLLQGWAGLSTLRCLIAHGSADDVVPVETSEQFVRLWPETRSRLVTYPGARHGFFNHPVHSVTVAGHIQRFIAPAE